MNADTTEKLKNITNASAGVHLDWTQIIVALIWPIVVIIFVYTFKGVINKLLGRITKASFLGGEIETQPIQQQTANIETRSQNLKQAVALFSNELRNDFKNLVIDESGYSENNVAEQNVAILLDYSTVIYIKIHFEWLYENIFGSQIQLLLYLNSIIGVGDTFDKLKTFYDQAVVNNPDSFGDYSYEQYINFLMNQGLIVTNEDKLIITIKGVDFLKYLTATNKSFNRPY